MMLNPAQNKGPTVAAGDANRGQRWDNQRAQNGPGVAELELWPGPDLSASLTMDEEH